MKVEGRARRLNGGLLVRRLEKRRAKKVAEWRRELSCGKGERRRKRDSESAREFI